MRITELNLLSWSHSNYCMLNVFIHLKMAERVLRMRLRQQPTQNRPLGFSSRTRRPSIFNHRWMKLFPWAERGSNEHCFRCIQCNCELSCNQGRESLSQHEATKKHRIQTRSESIRTDKQKTGYSVDKRNGCDKDKNAADVKIQDNDSLSLEGKGSTSCLATCLIVEDNGDHFCAHCCMKIKVKYQLVHQKKISYLCSDVCFQSFCNKQNLVCVLDSAKMPESSPDTCIVCGKVIQDGQVYSLPSKKKLCSEDCKQKYKESEATDFCAQCRERIKEKTKCITWTSKAFCNEACLDKYQILHSHHCPNCQSVIEKSSLGKFCLYTKTDIQDFCSLQCLDVFKKDPKVCKICGNFIFSGSKDVTADKLLYCEKCVVKYDTCTSASPSHQHNDMTTVGFRIKQEDTQENCDDSTESSPWRYSSIACYTCSNNIFPRCRSKLVLQLKGAYKTFCCKPCMNKFILSDRIFPCYWCKAKKPVTNMVERVDSINHVQLFCSLNCLSIFRVSLNATSSKDVMCDNCHHTLPAQYHLTMSDASVRNFCSYDCVLDFQKQFEDIPKITTATTI